MPGSAPWQLETKGKLLFLGLSSFTLVVFFSSSIFVVVVVLKNTVVNVLYLD